MSGNFNQTNMNRMQQQYNQNNPRNDMNFTRSNNPNIANTQAQKININQMPQQNTTNNQSNINNMTPVAQEDNFDFFKTIDKILKRPNSDERMENLGELIFYFLIDFIPKYKLNDSQGKFDDTILCSKLTGILIHEDDDEILEIFSSTDNLLVFIKSVVLVKYGSVLLLKIFYKISIKYLCYFRGYYKRIPTSPVTNAYKIK